MISDMDDKAKKVLDRLERQCARMEYCSSDILRKALKALEGDREAAEEVVASLVKDGYVDDLRYASAFAREKSSLQGWGEVKIRFMLSGKGISRPTIDEALKEIEPEKAEARLSRLASEKYRLLKDDPECRLKMLKFLLGRGYSYEEAASAAEAAMRAKTQ